MNCPELGSPPDSARCQSIADLVYLVTGGTGCFATATGGFRGDGLVTFAPGPLVSSEQLLRGRIVVAAVPEPDTWAMLVCGFALTGGMIRARQRRRAAALAGAARPNVTAPRSVRKGTCCSDSAQ